jgi:hypothetical protein
MFFVLNKSFKIIMKCFSSTSQKKKKNKMKLSLTKNKQTAELERGYASLGEELERKSACPSCGLNNMASVQDSYH